MKIKNTIIALCAVSLTACATILSGTTQTINVQAVDARNNQPLSGVVCNVVDGTGMRYPISGNPGTVTVRKGQGILKPECRKLGYTQTSVAVGESFNALTIVNVLFWPGFIVDAVSGTMQKYPSYISITMEPRGR